MVFMSHNVIPADFFLLKHLFTEGYAGVSFFFILSGFILSYSYQERLLSGKMNVLHFYKARIARIYPLHLLTFIIAAILLEPVYFKIQYFVKFISNLTLTQSFLPLKSAYFTFNAPSWSISDEMFFYLLFPFIIYLVYKRQNIFHILLFSTLTILFFLTFIIKKETYQHALFYINPIMRIADFCIGICLYNFCVRASAKRERMLKNVKWGGVEIISVTVFICFYLLAYYIPKVYRYSFWYWIPISLLIVVFYLSRNGLCSKVLSNKYFVLLGEISFGFYLFHQLIGRLFLGFISKMQIDVSYPYRFIIVFTITLIASYLSFKYYETPCNKKIKQLHISSFKNLFKIKQ
jgi:peptidoglycan/LPS O-acetylase OafA/YrhL